MSKSSGDYVDLGASYFMLYFADLPSTAGLRLFAETGATSFS